MLFVLFGTTIAWLLYVFTSMFDRFKKLQVNIPNKITKRQSKRLNDAFNNTTREIQKRVAMHRWYIDIATGILSYVWVPPIAALTILIASIYIFYGVSRDLGRLGIVAVSYSITYPVIAFILHVLTAFHSLKYPMK